MRRKARLAAARNRRALAFAVCLLSLLVEACSHRIGGNQATTVPEWLSQENDRGVTARSAFNPQLEPYRRKIALVVGIDRYENGIRPLDYAVDDARAVGQLLESKLGFKVRYLLNEQARREGLINAIIGLHDQTGRDDQLLFFFAGHGVSFGDGDSETSYILPRDAKGNAGDDENTAWDSGITMSELVGRLMKLPPKHILILLDTCFSGYAAVTARGSLERHPEQLLERLTSQPAHQILTGGMRGQRVFEGKEWHHSALVFELLQGLGEGLADRNRDGLVPISELYAYLKPAVTYRTHGAQTPFLANLDNHQGEFVFILRPRRLPSLTVEGVQRKALVTHPQALLFPSPYAHDARTLPFLSTLFLFEGEENHRVPVGLRAGAREPDGWIDADDFLEWNSLEVALVTPSGDGSLPIPLFATRDCALGFVEEKVDATCVSLPFETQSAAPGLVMVPLLERWGDAYRGALIWLQVNEQQILPPARDVKDEWEAAAEAQSSSPQLPLGWLPRKKGVQLLVQESVFMRRNKAEILTDLIECISLAARDGANEGATLFRQIVRATFSAVIGASPEDDEPFDTLLTQASGLPFRSTSLSFRPREVEHWQPADFERLDNLLRSKVEALREFLHDPKHAYDLGGKTFVFIPRELFP
jgi:caspase domain-containing protein